MKDSPDVRRRHLARIHILTKELDLTEPAYRNILAVLTGKRSSGDLTVTQRTTVIEFLQRQEPRTPQRPPLDPAREVVTDDEALAILGMAA